MSPNLARNIGLSFKLPHLGAILDTLPAVGFFEVHAENYMGFGGRPHHALRRLADHYPLSIHGVGLSLGSATPVDEEHLARLGRLVRAFQPRFVSEHLAWSHYRGAYLNDLLPIPYNTKTLRRMIAVVAHVQAALDRPLLLENPSSYLNPTGSDMSEPQFLSELARATGCKILLDVNNVFVSSANLGFDPHAYFLDFPFSEIAQIHMAGHHAALSEDGRKILIDTHDRLPSPDVLALYGHVLAHAGDVPTLLEWDRDVPDLAGLVDAARLIDSHRPSRMAA